MRGASGAAAAENAAASATAAATAAAVAAVRARAWCHPDRRADMRGIIAAGAAGSTPGGGGPMRGPRSSPGRRQIGLTRPSCDIAYLDAGRVVRLSLVFPRPPGVRSTFPVMMVRGITVLTRKTIVTRRFGAEA